MVCTSSKIRIKSIATCEESSDPMQMDVMRFTA
jgi:hypothetical protein